MLNVDPGTRVHYKRLTTDNTIGLQDAARRKPQEEPPRGGYGNSDGATSHARPVRLPRGRMSGRAVGDPAPACPGAGTAPRTGGRHGVADCAAGLRIRQPHPQRSGGCFRAPQRPERRWRRQQVAAVHAGHGQHLQQSGQRRPGQRAAARPGRHVHARAARRPAPHSGERQWRRRRQHHSAVADRERRGRDRWRIGGLRFGRDRRRGQLQAQEQVRGRAVRRRLGTNRSRRRLGVHRRNYRRTRVRRRPRQGLRLRRLCEARRGVAGRPPVFRDRAWLLRARSGWRWAGRRISAGRDPERSGRPRDGRTDPATEPGGFQRVVRVIRLPARHRSEGGQSAWLQRGREPVHARRRRNAGQCRELSR